PARPDELGVTPTLLRTGSVSVSGRLDGQLRGMELATETTDNVGSFELWEHGGGRTELDIAVGVNPSSAAMLMVTFLGNALADTLEAGEATVEQSPSDPSSVTTVTSCAGPAVGEWPYEMPAVSAEISAVNDPERPNGVLMVVTGRFADGERGPEATSELVGTFRFDRFD
ncbi:MAG TPA: hypothetical protein VNN80_19280, partial [Polyangiaceae bacterium]|nr:hypothetical protein [Polyangiaceae bacterium]